MGTISNITSKYPNLKILAVTKGRTVEEIKKLLKNSTITAIAENRLEEAMKKIPELDTKIEKHFIGKLQSRKIKKICQLFDVIQSVENLEQAKKISALGHKKIMLEINISQKENRGGAKITEAKNLIQQIKKLPNITLIGVMGIASTENSRSEFKILKMLQKDLPECSMGMSEDYQIAIEEGSTMLRLGRILFSKLEE